EWEWRVVVRGMRVGVVCGGGNVDIPCDEAEAADPAGRWLRCAAHERRVRCWIGSFGPDRVLDEGWDETDNDYDATGVKKQSHASNPPGTPAASLADNFRLQSTNWSNHS